MKWSNKRHRLLVRWGLLSLALTLAVGAVIAATAQRTGQAVPAAGAEGVGLTSVLSRRVEGTDVPIRFQDVTAQMGLNFAHLPSGRSSLLPEDMGSGVACGDYDTDGFVDLYLVNISGHASPNAPMDARAGRARLYRNLGGEAFEDVTDGAGVGFVGLGMGAAWGDYDNDGDLDLYVTAYGPNALYENRGDGTFVDVTERAGVQDHRFSTGATWSDFDRDGDLDLYVCNYVDFVFREEDRRAIKRQYATEQPYTLNPSSYAPAANSLFRNNGDRTFSDVAGELGVDDQGGRSLSAGAVDLNNDGWTDLYIANDVSNNAVFLNRSTPDGMQFEDIGASSLAADYRGAMGIAVADFDADLDQDLLITHWVAQENALYRNMLRDTLIGSAADERLYFMDDADGLGLGQISLDMVGWAAGFADFDNDALLDLWLVNGSTIERSDDHRRLKAQPGFLFWHRRNEGFVDVAGSAAPELANPAVRRGGAHFDFDGDGQLDLVIVEHGGPARLLKNVSATANHWLRIRLTQTGGNTHALGARVYATAGGITQMHEVGASSSYLSHDERTVHFGLNVMERIDRLRIVWPDGIEESHEAIAADQEVRFVHAAQYPVRRRD